jgi:molybdate transport system ATP-binding protein
MQVPQLDLPAGASLRVRVRARDVSIALEEPAQSSILNIFRGVVTAVGAEPGPQVDVLLRIGAGDGATSPLWARVTRKSVAGLGLATGTPVYALVKSVALDRSSLGRRPARGRFEGR